MGYVEDEESVQAEHTEANRMAERILNVLLSQQIRWQRVDFTWTCERLPSTFQGFQADNMPLLKSLHLSFFMVIEERKSVSALIDIAKSSHLKCLDLSEAFFLRFGDETLLSLTLPCSLRFAGIYSEELPGKTCLNLLRLVPNLKQLRVDFCDTDEHPPTPIDDSQEPIQHDLWCLAFYGNMFPRSIKEKIIFRSLEALKIIETTPTIQVEGQLLLEFVQRFTPALTFLSIRTMDCDLNILIPTLCLLLTLRVLRIFFQDAEVMGSFLEALTVKDEDGADNSIIHEPRRTLCPLLHSLHIKMEPNFFTKDGDACTTRIRLMLKSWCGILKTFQTQGLSEDNSPPSLLGPGNVDYRDFYEKLKMLLDKEGVLYAIPDIDEDSEDPFNFN